MCCLLVSLWSAIAPLACLVVLHIPPLCVYVCVCVYVCMHACVCICHNHIAYIYKESYAHTHTQQDRIFCVQHIKTNHSYTHIHIHTHTNTHMHTHTHTHTMIESVLCSASCALFTDAFTRVVSSPTAARESSKSMTNESTRFCNS
jgi:hypothetical protein